MQCTAVTRTGPARSGGMRPNAPLRRTSSSHASTQRPPSRPTADSSARPASHTCWRASRCRWRAPMRSTSGPAWRSTSATSPGRLRSNGSARRGRKGRRSPGRRRPVDRAARQGRGVRLGRDHPAPADLEGASRCARGVRRRGPRTSRARPHRGRSSAHTGTSVRRCPSQRKCIRATPGVDGSRIAS